MRRLVEFIGLLGVIGVQIALWPDLTTRYQPEFVLIAVFAWGLATSAASGFWAAFLAGLTLDFYTQQNFGMFTLALTLAVSPLWFMVQTRPSEVSEALRLTLFAGAVVGYELVLLIYLGLTTANFPFFAELTRVATLNVVSSVIIFALLTPLISRLAEQQAEPARPAATRP